MLARNFPGAWPEIFKMHDAGCTWVYVLAALRQR